MTEELEVTGMWYIKKYIWRWQATIADYITNHPIFELCMGADHIPGSSRL